MQLLSFQIVAGKKPSKMTTGSTASDGRKKKALKRELEKKQELAEKRKAALEQEKKAVEILLFLLNICTVFINFGRFRSWKDGRSVQRRYASANKNLKR